MSRLMSHASPTSNSKPQTPLYQETFVHLSPIPSDLAHISTHSNSDQSLSPTARHLYSQPLSIPFPVMPLSPHQQVHSSRDPVIPLTASHPSTQLSPDMPLSSHPQVHPSHHITKQHVPYPNQTVHSPTPNLSPKTVNPVLTSLHQQPYSLDMSLSFDQQGQSLNPTNIQLDPLAI